MKPFLLGLLLLAAMPAAAQDVRIDDVHVFPESLSADRAGRLYIGSTKGVIFRSAPKGDLAEPWIVPDAEHGLLSVLPMVLARYSVQIIGRFNGASSAIRASNPAGSA